MDLRTHIFKIYFLQCKYEWYTATLPVTEKSKNYELNECIALAES